MNKIAAYIDGAKTYLKDLLTGIFALLIYFRVGPFKTVTVDGTALAMAVLAIVSSGTRLVTWKPGALANVDVLRAPNGTTVIVKKGDEPMEGA